LLSVLTIVLPIYSNKISQSYYTIYNNGIRNDFFDRVSKSKMTMENADRKKVARAEVKCMFFYPWA
jgi:hypothetical protein